MQKLLLIGALSLIGALLLTCTRPSPPLVPVLAKRPSMEEARAAFEALVDRGWLRGLDEPRGGWVPTPAIADKPPAVLVNHHRALLLAEVVAHARPEAGTREGASRRTAMLRQGLALGMLAVEPTASEAERVHALLKAERIWQPWRGAVVLAGTGDAAWFPVLRSLVDAQPFGYSRAQASMALGVLGHPAGAARLEAFVRANHGQQGDGFGKHALIILGGTSPEARRAVVRVALSLMRTHPNGIRTDGGVPWYEDHPGRVSYLQTTAIEILRNVGTAEDAESLLRAKAWLVQPTQPLLDYLAASIEIMRARSPR